MTVRISDVRQANQHWFSLGNQRFFGDMEYRVLHSRQGNPYLVRRTKMWSDMFGQKPTQVFRVNCLNPDLSIGELEDPIFSSLSDVKVWLKNQ